MTTEPGTMPFPSTRSNSPMPVVMVLVALAPILVMGCAGLHPVKVNAVVMPGVNEDSIVPLAEYCIEAGAARRALLPRWM